MIMILISAVKQPQRVAVLLLLQTTRGRPYTRTPIRSAILSHQFIRDKPWLFCNRYREVTPPRSRVTFDDIGAADSPIASTISCEALVNDRAELVRTRATTNLVLATRTTDMMPCERFAAVALANGNHRPGNERRSDGGERWRAPCTR
jgi:hypothetical protein